MQAKIEKIIEVTKCMEIDLIKDSLAINNFDTELTIEMLMTNLNLNSDCQSNKSSSSSKKTEKKDKKMEKKQRQMERQREKILEQQCEKESREKQQTHASFTALNCLQANNSNVDLSVSISKNETQTI
jgi:hypothetical protein